LRAKPLAERQNAGHSKHASRQLKELTFTKRSRSSLPVSKFVYIYLIRGINSFIDYYK